MVDYYESKINEKLDEEEFLPETGFEPKIASQFTDWKYKTMRNVVKFCQENDHHKPNFMESLVNDKIIRKECNPPTNSPMNTHEKELMEKTINKFYRKNWPKIILKIMRYNNPLVANVSQISSLSTEMDLE